MVLLDEKLRERLLENGRIRVLFDDRGVPDFFPVVKFFTPDAGCVWLLTDLNPDDPDSAYGLCDLGMGYPQMGKVLISELEAVRGAQGLPVERDPHFTPTKTISAYAEEARERGRIETA